jgi:hypothetical protein
VSVNTQLYPRCRKFSAAESEQPGIESDQRSLQALAGRLGYAAAGAPALTIDAGISESSGPTAAAMAGRCSFRAARGRCGAVHGGWLEMRSTLVLSVGFLFNFTAWHSAQNLQAGARGGRRGGAAAMMRDATLAGGCPVLLIGSPDAYCSY